MKKLCNILNKLEKAEYRASKKNQKFLSAKQKVWDMKLTKTESNLKEKVKAILKLNPPENKGTEIISRGDTIHGKISTENFGTDGPTDKKEPWIWEEQQQKDFKKVKQNLSESPCLAHYPKVKENILTTDASTTGFGITLWQKQDDGITKPIASGSKQKRNTRSVNWNY